MKLPAALRVLLWPASLIWGFIARLRAFAYRRAWLRSRRLPGTVISVGNLTAGGTGKTPMVLWIAQRLHAEGKRVGILTRGYRSRIDQPGGVPQSDEVAIYRERLAHHAELGVGADRFASGEALSRHGIQWFLLDDGFQHLRLARDVDVVLLDATDPFSGGWLLPAGMLREPKSALARADVIVITRSKHTPAIEAVVRRFTNAPIFHACTSLGDVLPVPGESSGDSSAGLSVDWRNKKAFAFCGIGNPRAFFDDLKRWGANIAGQASFPDHHPFTSADAAKLEGQARAAGAEIFICTEKDVFNLKSAHFSTLPVLFVRMDLAIVDAERFWRAVQSTIAQKRAS